MKGWRHGELTAAGHEALAAKGWDVSRRAPVQGNYWRPKGERGQAPGTIDWIEHEEIWKAYAREFPSSAASQDAARIAERGGFGYGEIVALTGAPPKTWEQVEG